jgi:Fe-S-cluster containining protein
MADAGRYFWNSPGMVIMRGGMRQRIRTITPRFVNGRCVFYQNRRCLIHTVAPFGCRYFDVHMNMQTAQMRSMWGATQIIEHETEYAAERDQLAEATHYQPKGY